MIIVGFSCFYHDSAACILKDGEIIAAALEERFTRVKHDNSFPEKAIEFCLNSLRIAANEVDAFVFYEKPIKKFDRMLSQIIATFPKSIMTFTSTIPSWTKEKLDVREILRKKFNYVNKLYFVDHHLSHAASAYYLSGYKDSVILTMDGVGEWSTTTLGTGKGNTINIEKEIKFPNSLGLLYSAITAYLGFKVNSHEYEVMGLSAYGNPDHFFQKFKKIVKTFSDGSFELNMKYFDFLWNSRMPSREMEKLFGYKTRLKNEPIEDHHKNIAASLQKTVEEIVFNLLDKIHNKYGSDNLCVAGGVGLNSLMNGKVLSRTPFKSVFIPPDPGDAGGAMGAALFVANYFSDLKLPVDNLPFLGPEYGNIEIKSKLDQFKLKYSFFTKKRLVNVTSNLLIKQKIIGWFQGKMEWGPRALGARSILASATDASIRDKINAAVKHREMFRPFAPAILEEYVDKYFYKDKKLPISSRFMLLVYKFKKKFRGLVPAVVHVDGTGRLQSVKRKDNELYYDLINAYRQKTGIPLILNTSFNLGGEPIVCTPEDAIKSFLATNIDYLVIGNYLVEK